LKNAVYSKVLSFSSNSLVSYLIKKESILLKEAMQHPMSKSDENDDIPMPSDFLFDDRVFQPPFRGLAHKIGRNL
jgi:hypothetical protein